MMMPEGGRGGAAATMQASLSVSPTSAVVRVGNTLTFTATTSAGAAAPDVDWSVGGANCGSINSEGVYTAPTALPDPPVCQVEAVGAGGSPSASATVRLSNNMASGAVGVWENVTPSEISLDPNFHGQAQNFGATGMVADPVNPAELYAFFCYQGVWKSTDYGITWKKISTGTNGSVLDDGRPWTAIGDNDAKRNPSTPLTLYTANGYGSSLGVFKSTDGGVNWSIYDPGVDLYSYDMDPYDNQHLITGMHEDSALRESFDGGKTWKNLTTPPDAGKSIYPYFIDTGNPASTRTTWVTVPQVDTGSSYFTTNAGASFSLTAGGTFAHPHGNNQLFRDRPNVAYAAGSGGVWRTTDGGANWNKMYPSNAAYTWANGVTGTKDWLYAWDTGSNNGGIGGPHLMKAPRAQGTPWTPMDAPAEMNNGPSHLAVTSDGAHYILVGGAMNAGLWRYVEP